MKGTNPSNRGLPIKTRLLLFDMTANIRPRVTNMGRGNGGHTSPYLV